MGWNSSSSAGQTSAHLSYSDNRQFGDQEVTAQLFNIQVSRRQSMSRRATLVGHVSYQSSERQKSGEVDLGPSSAATVSLAYNYMRPFGLQRLSVTSQLKGVANRPAAGDERNEWLWDSRIQHSVGKLNTSLTYRMQVIDDATSNMVLFQLRRTF